VKKSHTLLKAGNTHAWASAGRGQNGHLPPLEIGPKNQNFLENMKSASQFRIIDLILAMTLYLPVRQSHCTRARFTVLVSCSSELAGSNAWPNLGADSSAVGLYCVTIHWFTSSYDSRRFAACCCLLLNADILADNAAGQWLLIAASHVVLYCVKRNQSESIAMQPHVWNIHCWCSVSRDVVLAKKVWERSQKTSHLKQLQI